MPRLPSPTKSEQAVGEKNSIVVYVHERQLGSYSQNRVSAPATGPVVLLTSDGFCPATASALRLHWQSPHLTLKSHDSGHCR